MSAISSLPYLRWQLSPFCFIFPFYPEAFSAVPWLCFAPAGKDFCSLGTASCPSTLPLRWSLAAQDHPQLPPTSSPAAAPAPHEQQHPPNHTSSNTLPTTPAATPSPTTQQQHPSCKPSSNKTRPTPASTAPLQHQRFTRGGHQWNATTLRRPQQLRSTAKIPHSAHKVIFWAQGSSPGPTYLRMPLTAHHSARRAHRLGSRHTAAAAPPSRPGPPPRQLRALGLHWSTLAPTYTSGIPGRAPQSHPPRLRPQPAQDSSSNIF